MRILDIQRTGFIDHPLSLREYHQINRLLVLLLDVIYFHWYILRVVVLTMGEIINVDGKPNLQKYLRGIGTVKAITLQKRISLI